MPQNMPHTLIHLPEFYWLFSSFKDIDEEIDNIRINNPQAGRSAMTRGISDTELFRVWNDYLEKQEYCLDNFKEMENEIKKNKILEGIVGDSQKLCLFVFGSSARLEYVPGVSDVDILPICKGVKQNELDKEAKKFQDLKLELQKIVEKIFGKTTKVDMHGIKLGDKKYFVSKQDLIELMDTELERSWSRGERSCLLWESVYLAGNHEFAQELRDEVLETYSCLPDFEKGRFPKLIYIFAQEVLAQGLGNAIHEMIEKMEKGKANKNDRDLAKLLFARFVGVKVKQLGWHLLFWIRQRDKSFSRRTRNSLDSLLNQPPMYCGLHGLNQLRQILASNDPQPSFEQWLPEQLKNIEASETQIKELTKSLDNVMDFVLIEGNKGRRRNKDINIANLMIDLWYSCWLVRSGDKQELQDMKRLGRKAAKLLEITGDAAKITQWLEKIRLDKLEKQGTLSLNPYERCWHLIQPILFPESKPIWES